MISPLTHAWGRLSKFHCFSGVSYNMSFRFAFRSHTSRPVCCCCCFFGRVRGYSVRAILRLLGEAAPRQKDSQLQEECCQARLHRYPSLVRRKLQGSDNTGDGCSLVVVGIVSSLVSLLVGRSGSIVYMLKTCPNLLSPLLERTHELLNTWPLGRGCTSLYVGQK